MKSSAALVRSIIPFFLFVLLAVPSGVFGAASNPPGEARELLLSGRLTQAGQVLQTAARAGEEGDKIKALQAVADYLDPYWHPEDFSALEAAGKPALQLMRDFITAPYPPGAGREQKEWLLFCRIRLIGALVKLDGPGAAGFLTKLLDERDVRLRLAAVDGLARTKSKEAVEPLFDYLGLERVPDYSPGSDVAAQARMEEAARARAVAGIVSIGGGSLLQRLRHDLEKGSPPDRMTAGIILTGLRLEEAREDYVKMLADREEQLRVYAASALQDMGDGRGLDAVLKLFDSPEIQKKLWLSDTLSGWKDPRAARFFLDYMKKEIPAKPLGYVPLSNLGKVPVAERITDPGLLLITRMMQTLISWKEISAPVMLEYLKGEPGSLAYPLMEMLGETTDPAAIPAMRAMLKKGGPMETYYALWGLARLGDDKSAPDAEKLLQSGDGHVQAASAWALARLGSGKGYETAVRLLGSKDPGVISTALDTLYYTRRKESAPEVFRALSAGLPDPYLERQAVILLGILKDSASADLLRQAASGSGVNAYFAAEALYRVTGRPVKTGMENISPADFPLYRQGEYDDADYARVLLLYLSLEPDRFFSINEPEMGVCGEFPEYGEFGRKTGTITNIFLRKDGTKDSEVTGSLPPGAAFVVKEYRGRMARVAAMDGREGWVFTPAIRSLGKSGDGVRRRFRADYGCRWKEDLEWIIENDYMEKSPFQVKYDNPMAVAGERSAGIILDAFFRLGRGRGPSEEEFSMAGRLDTGKKSAAISLQKTFRFDFDGAGSLERMTVEER
jgi:HEAT repeat protein